MSGERHSECLTLTCVLNKQMVVYKYNGSDANFYPVSFLMMLSMAVMDEFRGSISSLVPK